MSNLTHKLHSVSYYQKLAQKHCPAGIKLLADAARFLHEVMRNTETSKVGKKEFPRYAIGDKIKAASALVKAVDTISKASGLYTPHVEDSSIAVETLLKTLPLIHITLAIPEPKKVIELNPQSNGVHK